MGVVKESLKQSSDSDEIEHEKRVDKEKTKEARYLMKSVKSTLEKLSKASSDDIEEEEEEEVDVAGPLKVALDEMAAEHTRAIAPGSKEELDEEALKRKRLFQGLTFFLSREVPRGYLELVCLAHGAKVGWDGENSPISSSDATITHHIVDRPKLPSSYDTLPKSREFIQPQWILDCTNFLFLLPIARYAVGSKLPPHLSPWVDNEEEGYKPAYAEEIERIKNGEKAFTGKISVGQDEENSPKDDSEVASTKDFSESEKDEDGDEDDTESKELTEKKRQMEEKEAHELAKTMMSRKASHLYGRMQHGLSRKKERVEELQRRRKELDGKVKDSSGKTVLKQKVERLKKERKGLEDSYEQSSGSMKKSKKRRSS